jgi:hypothetical protein
MLLSPAAGVAAVIQAAPGLGRLAVALGLIGLLRGSVEGFWYYLMTGHVRDLASLLARPDWYLRWGGPFILLNIPSAHFLWLTTALTLHLTGRMLGGRSDLRRVLQATGVALFSYLAIGLINYLHVWFPLPSVTLRASAFYSPSLGLGQLVTFVWLTLVCYHVLRQVYDLPPLSALLGAPLPVLFSLVLYVASAGVFFGVLTRLPGGPHPTRWLELANGAYLFATVALSLLMALLARYLLKGGEQNERRT